MKLSRIGRAYVSPAGAMLLIVCFFLPWARCSCGPGLGRTISGPVLGGSTWLAVVAPAVLLLISAVLVLIRRATWVWLPALAAAFVTLGAVGLALARASRGVGLGIVRVSAEHFDLHLRPGGVGLILGWCVLMAGAMLTLPAPPNPGRRARLRRWIGPTRRPPRAAGSLHP